MARKRGGGRFRRYIRGNVDESQQLTTLAANTAVKQAITDTVDDTTFVSSLDLIWSLSGVTPVDGAGPILVGIAHSDYTLAEIEEWIELSTGWSQADLRSKEISQRKIRRVGSFSTADADPNSTQVLNDGKPIKTIAKWVLAEGQTVALWYYNQGSQAFATTTPECGTQGHANLWPM